MKFYIVTPSLLLQQVRLIHALSESSHEIVLPYDEIEKYQPLIDFFGAHFEHGECGDIVLDDHLTIDHSTPRTYIGSIHRHIIFPHAIPKYTRSLWRERNYRFSFVGLITENRKTQLDNWVKKNIENDIASRLFRKIRNRFIRLTKLGKIINPITPEQFVIWSSEKGRAFPGKSWDDDYFRLLANSKFVLCPNGDYIWSYRFFEAILCGAIPVVEQTCEAFQGFRYYTMQDQANNLIWSEEDVIYNFSLCVERITIPVEQLEKELDRIANQWVVTQPKDLSEKK